MCSYPLPADWLNYERVSMLLQRAGKSPKRLILQYRNDYLAARNASSWL